MSMSVILRKSLIEVLNKKNEKKKDVAREISTSQQSLSDWTSQNNVKPVTIENALRLSDHFRDSAFTMEVIHQFLEYLKLAMVMFIEKILHHWTDYRKSNPMKEKC